MHPRAGTSPTTSGHLFSTKKTGTGLGLAIASTVISDHGGYIKVVDNQPVGARFVVELPLNQDT